MSRAFSIASCDLCHILQRLFLFNPDESSRTCACCIAIGRRSESPDSYHPSLADEELMNASIHTTQTSYMTAPEYLDYVSDAGYSADNEEESEDESEDESEGDCTRRDSYASMMDYLRGIESPSEPTDTSSREDDFSDDDYSDNDYSDNDYSDNDYSEDDILSTPSESHASTLTSRDNYASIMDYLRGIESPSEPTDTSSREDDFSDDDYSDEKYSNENYSDDDYNDNDYSEDDILSTPSESRASTPEWLDEPSIPRFMVPSLAYMPDDSHLFPGAMSPSDSSVYTSSAYSYYSSATTSPPLWSDVPPTFTSLSSDGHYSPAFQGSSTPPYARKHSIAYPGEPGYDPCDHAEYILFGIEPDRRKMPAELTSPRPKRPVLTERIKDLCEVWGKEEMVRKGGQRIHDGGKTRQEHEDEAELFRWWKEEGRKAREVFDMDTVYNRRDVHGQGVNVWGSQGLPQDQSQMRGLCCW